LILVGVWWMGRRSSKS